jgi:hypothetical protein
VRTRLVSDIIEAAAGNNPAKAAQLVQRRYPHGIRPENIPPLVKSANICLRNLFRLPRLTGFGIGFAVCAILNAAWLFSPLRGMVVAQAGAAAAIGMDVLLPVIGAGAASLAVLLTCANAINRVLGRKKKAGNKQGGKKLAPKPGESIAAGFGASLLAFLVMLHVAFMTSHAPSWYAALMHMIGL